MIYVDVAVDNKSKYTDGLFTYKSPVDIRPGDLVTVPFGSGDREKKAIGLRDADKDRLPLR